MAARILIALACLQVVALANSAGYGGYGSYGGYGYPGYPGYGGYGGYGYEPSCAPPVKVIEKPVPQPVLQEVAVAVPQPLPVTIPNPTFLDANTRITTVSGSTGGEVKSTHTGSGNPNGDIPDAHYAPLRQANPWAFTSPQYPTLSPIGYGNTLFGPLL